MRRSCLLAAITLLACGGNKGNATSDGGWDGGGGGGGGGGGVSVQPLSNDTFVFVREVREGAKHLYTYDTSTNQATLLSALDDDGQFGTSEVTGLAVSPDRKLIAFGALFRATVADKANPAHAIWTVTADGKTYARQTAPLPHPGLECTSDANCTYPERCNTLRGHCERYNTRTSLYHPAFTPDQQHLYFNISSIWIDGTGKLVGGGSIYSVPVGGGPMESWDVNGDCTFADHPSVSPSGTKMIIQKGICLDSLSGYYLHNQPPEPGIGAPVLTSTDTIGFSCEQAVWWDDQSVLLIGPTSLVYVDLATGSAQDVLTAGESQTLGPFAVSPDRTRMVICVYGNGQTLYLVDLTGSADPVALTTDGRSCTPAW